MTRPRRRDLDPVEAEDKTGQDIWTWFLGYCRTKVKSGFTRAEVDGHSRADSNVIRLLVSACEDAGHLARIGVRLYPQDSLFTVQRAQVIPAYRIGVEAIEPCRAAKGCPGYGTWEEHWRIVCTVCGPSSTHWPTEEEAQNALSGGYNYHRDRKSHSDVPRAVLK